MYWFVIEKACAGLANVFVWLANGPLFIARVLVAAANAARAKRTEAEKHENAVP